MINWSASITRNVCTVRALARRFVYVVFDSFFVFAFQAGCDDIEIPLTFVVGVAVDYLKIFGAIRCLRYVAVVFWFDDSTSEFDHLSLKLIFTENKPRTHTYIQPSPRLALAATAIQCTIESCIRDSLCVQKSVLLFLNYSMISA